MDQEVSRLAKSRGVSKSQILREAAAAYVEAS
nr:ribbon-helix-helix protein, CopG family [Rathayibacter sp. VKM Ac-2835]